MSCGNHIVYAQGLFEKVLDDGVDILLANEEETEVWWDVKKGAALPEYNEAVAMYEEYADIVALKLGKRGVMIHFDGNYQTIPIFEDEKTFVNDNGHPDGFAIELGDRVAVGE